jgi:hypothetical protein
MRASVVIRLLCAGAFCALGTASPALEVSGTSPAQNAGNVARDAAVVIDFDRPVNVATVTNASLRVWGRSGGRMPGTIAWSNGDRRLSFAPGRAFFPGELVHVNLSTAIAGTDGSSLRTGGWTLNYLTVAGPGGFEFALIDSVSVRSPGGPATRLYGGNFPDINHDGWIDYIAVNEVSADLRVLLNRADGSGRVHPVLQPPTPIGVEASPNEVADFNDDGWLDMATANATSHSVSVVLGRGDGTFAPQQEVLVATSPHGLAVLDVDGDADLDLVVASYNGNTMSLLRNAGNGVFGNRVDFDSGGDGEYALGYGDMDNDGRVDLVVGSQNDQRIRVLRNNGDGTFTAQPAALARGRPWMLAVGDVNGDRFLDVAVANGTSNNAAILLGNGDGSLQAGVTVNLGTGVSTLIATDLGDLDGDGDLDWVLSSFGGARWYVLENGGAGNFSLVRQITAPQAASCGSLYDFDNDGDLDMALADELADVVRLYRNTGALLFANGFEVP